jgi:spore cortex protein
MKLKLILIASFLFSLYLTGCARNNVNDDVANRNRDGVGPTRVNYNPNVDRTTPNVTDVRYNNRNGAPIVDRTNPNVTDVRYNNRNVNNVGDNRSRMQVADQAANRVADLKEVDQANVIVTDNNAYVAAKLANNEGDKLTNKIEKKISNRVKSVDHDIDHVYVSVNPDFFKQMNDYAGDIRSGKPVSGFFNEFSQSIRRVFPDLK